LWQRARRRAGELAKDADVRLSPPKVKPVSARPAERTKTAALVVKSDDRLPPARAIITRDYKGETLQAKVVLPQGFE
jgi:hypothetical protein